MTSSNSKIVNDVMQTLSTEQLEQSQKGILVGRMINQDFQEASDELYQSLQMHFQDSDVSPILRNFRQLFVPTAGWNGTFFRCSESCIVQGSQSEFAAFIEKILQVTVDTVPVPVILYNEWKFTNTKDQWTGNDFVYLESNSAICSASSIKRKVIVTEAFHTPNHSNILIDHQRTKLPLTSNDIQVPFYPEKGDMVKISSDDIDPYFGLVRQVLKKEKKVKVQYFMLNNEKTAVSPYVDGRGAFDLVSWDAILGKANGTFNGNIYTLSSRI